ncbi:hypothetical protein [Rickettsia endosymbiont of Halotydeus destructor]|uniref:hypothetical protein n=1 Tax=Rickettsia endosymbiont of Halotydeus destructor TaxID=2996754 RepID=UPI003BAF0352
MSNPNNKTYHKEQLTSKPILFLQPPFDLESKQIREELTAYCEQKGHGILKTVKSISPYDYDSFHKLIRIINNWQVKPVMVLIDYYSLRTPINKILWAVIGTLRTAELIKIYVYVREGKELSLRQLNKRENDFLCQAVIYDKSPDIGSWNKWRTILDVEGWGRFENVTRETARYSEWEKAKGN